VNINLWAVDRQWEAGFPQLLLYSGDTVWRESVGGLTLLFHALHRCGQFEFQTLPRLAAFKATEFCLWSVEK
jgi:hypothetical protein